MAFARFNRDSDVYVYEDTDGGFRCERCPDVGSHFWCATAAEMSAHLREHQAKGQKVPARAFEDLVRDEPEQALWDLWDGEVFLGRLFEEDQDFPFTHCAFEPSPAFEPLRQEFGAERGRAEIDAQIRRGVHLRTTGSSKRLTVALIVEDNKAWFRHLPPYQLP